MSTMPTAPSQQPPLAPVGAAGHAEDEIDLSRESVAGEEDPGASLDLGTPPVKPAA